MRIANILLTLRRKQNKVTNPSSTLIIQENNYLYIKYAENSININISTRHFGWWCSKINQFEIDFDPKRIILMWELESGSEDNLSLYLGIIFKPDEGLRYLPFYHSKFIFFLFFNHFIGLRQMLKFWKKTLVKLLEMSLIMVF